MLYFMIALCGCLSYLSIIGKFYPLKIAAGFSWWGLFAYWLGSENLVKGSPADTIVMLVIFMLGLLFMIWAISSRKPASDVEETWSPTGRLLNRIVKSTRSNQPKPSSSMMTESTLEYRDRVRKAIKSGRKRK